jgi:hypothetical protein
MYAEKKLPLKKEEEVFKDGSFKKIGVQSVQ